MTRGGISYISFFILSMLSVSENPVESPESDIWFPSSWLEGILSGNQLKTIQSYPPLLCMDGTWAIGFLLPLQESNGLVDHLLTHVGGYLQ